MRSLFVALSVVCLTGAAPLAPAAARPALRLRGGGNSGGGGGGGSATLVAARGGKRAAAAEEEATARGVAGLVGGILIHLACGSMYTWGNLVSYAPPHLKYWAGAVGSGPADAQLVLPLILVSQMTGMPLGPLLEKKLGPTLTALLGALMMGIGVMAAATAPSLASFCVCYAVVFGLGVGVAYQMPIIAGGRWFPAKKGVVTGSVVTGMGASAFLFNLLATRLINPKGLNAVGGVFPAEVYANWPHAIRTLGSLYTGLAVCGALLQSNPSSFAGAYPWRDALCGKRHAPTPKARKAVAAAPGGPSLPSLVFAPKFAAMWLMILGSAVGGLNVAGSYKTFGLKQPQLNSDSFLTVVGALSAIFGNAAGRFFFGALSDAIGFKASFVPLTLLQGTTLLSFPALAASRLTFLLATVAMLFCMGGTFALFPAQAMRVYGASGASVYSIMFTAFGSAALLGPIASNALLQRGGYPLVFSVLGLCSFGSAALTLASQ